MCGRFLSFHTTPWRLPSFHSCTWELKVTEVQACLQSKYLSPSMAPSFLKDLYLSYFDFAKAGAREMAQQVRALTVLPEDLGLSLSSHMAAQPSVTLVPEDPMSSSGLCRHCKHMIYKHICQQNSHTYKTKQILKNVWCSSGFNNM